MRGPGITRGLFISPLLHTPSRKRSLCYNKFISLTHVLSASTTSSQNDEVHHADLRIHLPGMQARLCRYPLHQGNGGKARRHVPGLQERQRREKVQRIYRCDVEEVLIPPVLSPPEPQPMGSLAGACPDLIGAPSAMERTISGRE